MYFRNFPLLDYITDNKQLETIHDILVRVGINEPTRIKSQSFFQYTVSEGQTPESIAEDVYGDPELFWIVLLFNDLLDPLYSIPTRSKSLDNFTQRKHRSKTLFITPEGNSEKFFEHPYGGTSTIPTFTEGDTITLYLGKKFSYKDTGEDKVLGIVRRFLPEICAVELDSLQGSIKKGDVIVRGYNGEIRASVSKVIDSRYALHHFEHLGRILNPMATPPDDNGNQVPVGQTGDGFSLVPVGITQTILENYINENNTTYVVTNEDHEFLSNQTKMHLNLLHPTLVSDAISQLNEALKQ